MLDKTKTTPIKIEILDISPKNRASLEFYFEGKGKFLFKKSNHESASAYLLDYDFPGAKDTWQSVYEETFKPFIIFSSVKIDLLSAVSITKPITTEKLIDAGHKLQEILYSREVVLNESHSLEVETEENNDASDTSSEASLDELLKELTASDTPDQDSEKTVAQEAEESYIPVTHSAVVSSKVATEKNIKLISDQEADELLESLQHKDSKPSKPEEYTSKIKRELTKAEKRWALLCGLNNDIASADDIKQMHTNNDQLLSRLQTISFDSNEYVFSDFLQVIKQATDNSQVIEMLFSNRAMIIDYKTKYIHCDNSIYSESFALFCSEPLNKGSYKLSIIEDVEKITQLREVVENNTNTAYSIESFIWTSSMLTAQGRLPQQTNILDRFTLKHWPDLTRLEQVPHAIRIAAVFYKHPGNLLEVANWLHIPQRYVFSFYNAVLALDMIETLEPIENEKPESSFFNTEEEQPTEKKENRGMFSRLLTKLGA